MKITSCETNNLFFEKSVESFHRIQEYLNDFDVIFD